MTDIRYFEMARMLTHEGITWPCCQSGFRYERRIARLYAMMVRLTLNFMPQIEWQLLQTQRSASVSNVGRHITPSGG